MKKLPAILKQSTGVVTRITDMEERFNNVSAIADTADRLLALHAFREELGVEIKGDNPLNALRGLDVERAKMLSMVGGIGAMAAFGVAAGLVAAVAAPVVLPVAGAAVKKGYDRYFGEKKTVAAFEQRVSATLAQAMAQADVELIALSPQAFAVFETFPDLKERFVLASCVNKVRAESAELRAHPSLEKQAPPAKPEL